MVKLVITPKDGHKKEEEIHLDEVSKVVEAFEKLFKGQYNSIELMERKE
jgi:hypothetical protein